MYAKHIGWLSSRPKLHDKDDKKLSRIETLPDDDPLIKIPMPDKFICRIWHELGMFKRSHGLGKDTIPWVELESYCRQLKIDADPIDLELVMMMSNEFIRFEHLASENRNIKPPYQPVVTREDLVARFKKIDKIVEAD